jgi:hypothetical protein
MENKTEPKAEAPKPTAEEKIEKDMNLDVKRMAELSGENKRKIFDEDGNGYEFRPVALKDLPKLIKLIDSLKNTEKLISEEPEKFIDIVSDIMVMGLRKSGITKEQVVEKFTLESFTSIVNYATDVNGFFQPKKMTTS